MLAWRAIGNVLRSLHEIISSNTEEAPNPTTLDQLRDVGEKFYWSVYTLDRRWGFGTGLPFAVHDSDIHRQPQFKVGAVAIFAHLFSRRERNLILVAG